MNGFEILHGNEQLKTFFSLQIERGTLAHAYIIDGEEGTGRHTLALAVATALAGDDPLGKKIVKGISPDVRIYGPAEDKKQFTVGTVRTLREDAYLLPNDLPFKFFILERTETMNQEAQNAALKILEEPPANTYFFLLCSGAASLLPTIRSRAPVFRMQRFDVGELDGFFSADEELRTKKKQDEEFYYSCLRQSCGSYGRALQLLGGDRAKESRATAEELLRCMGNRSALLLMTARLPKKRQELQEVYTYLQWALRDILVLRSGGAEDDLIFFSDRERALSALPGRAKEQLIALLDLVGRLQEALESNANIQNLRFALLIGVQSALDR